MFQVNEVQPSINETVEEEVAEGNSDLDAGQSATSSSNQCKFLPYIDSY